MKKIFSITSVLIILLASCSKELDQLPISIPVTETFYKQPSDFVQAANAIYNSLRGYPDRLLFLSEVRSDNIYPTNEVARDPDPINNFSTNIASNVYVEEAWSTNFNGIFRANTLLDQIEKNGSLVGTPALANRLSAEARFLRAFFYFDLVRYYGKLPIVTRPVLTTEAITIPRSPVDSVYSLIISDLRYAVATLPVNFAGPFPNYTATDVGRATKYAAEALLAQVYMARSGATYGIEGPGRGVNEWSLALPLLQDVITNGGFIFNPNYRNIFSYNNQSPAANREAIFDVIYLSGQNPVLGATFPWQLAPQAYFNQLPNYNSTLANGALGVPSVSLNLFNSYTATDTTRRSHTIRSTPYTFTGITDTRPFFRKYLDTSRIPTASRFDWGINFIAIRYTDILMLKAECILRGATGTQAEVDAIVNQVRARASQPAITGVTLPQLFEERRKEFANEGSRWFDLQRSGNLITIMNAWIAVEDAAQKKMSAVTANSVIYPVPQSQLDAAPGLYQQNLGY